ncbi:MAG: hypothetical protein ACYDCC_11395 [Actinomycetota bacterium]
MKVRLIAFAAMLAVAAGGSFTVAMRNPAAAAHSSKKIDAQSLPILGADDFLTGNSVRRAFAPGIAIVYWAANDLWLYNTTTRDSRQLTHDGDKRMEVLARFRGRNAVSYVVDNQVYLYDLTLDRSTLLATVPSSINAYDISPDQSELAMVYDITNVSSGEALRYVRLVNLHSHSFRTIPFGGAIPTDTCGSDDHETHVTFSYDGSRMLVEDTTEDSNNKTSFVFDLTGRDLVRPMHAVWARWIPGTLSFIARGYTSMSWFTTDTVSGVSDVYPLPDDARRPMFSPDASQIVFDNGSSSPKVSVYEVETQRYHLITHGYVAAAWVAPNQFLASVADSCDGCPIPWIPGRGAALIGTAGSIDRLPFDSSLTADVEFHA